MTGAVALLARTKVVDVVARAAGGRVIRVPIWVVVVAGVPYVASYLAGRGQWWRAVRETGRGTIVVGDRRIAFTARPETDPATRRAVSAAFARKYRGSRSVSSMRTPAVLATTLRLKVGD